MLAPWPALMVPALLLVSGSAAADTPAPFTLGDALTRYWIAVVGGATVLVLLVGLTSRTLQLNQQLSRANARLEQRQQLILDSVAEGIYGIDRDGRTTFANKAMERMSGWRAAEIIGQNSHELLHHTRPDGEPHPQETCPVHATCMDSQPRFVDDDVFWRRDGTSFPVEYSVTPLLGERGETIGSVVVFRNIAERRRQAERIRQYEVEQAHNMRLSTLGEMASGIAHELNQPLTAITTNARACIRLIEAGRSDAEHCIQIVSKIAAQAERAGEVIRHIRSFVRKELPEVAPVAVAEMFETVMVLLGADARRASVVLTQRISADVDQVLAQRTQIEQVLLNLARNAIEAMAEQIGERRVLLLARRQGSMVEFRVVDTGPGLGQGSPEYLFEAFVTTKPQGLGVGLSISAGIVEAHGGRLRADSTPGIGATFYFSLPCASNAGAETMAVTTADSEKPEKEAVQSMAATVDSAGDRA
ncbi:two-component system sensor histidine kinase NtrB [Thiohalocapsa marina]|uniref:two-component system sensor histidine kinase NtrB n=1 Tax=Thiohalocapsa marina TaxID=424902 RepID=UPI00147970F4|nr:ATP-binding protein [Thiohalocapsa marina]